MNGDKMGIISAKFNQKNKPYSLQVGTENKTITYLNNGIPFLINDKMYILTCYHCIKNTFDQEFTLQNTKYKTGIEFISDELELALLSFESLNVHSSNYYSLEDLHQSLNIRVKSFELLAMNVITKKKLVMDCKFKTVEFKKNNIVSKNIPELPFIVVTLTGNYIDVSELKGLSGSILYANKKIYGILSHINDSDMYIIPSCTINRFINEIIHRNAFYGICTIVGQYTDCDFDVENKKTYGIYMDNVLNINYNNFSQNNTVNGGKIKDNDIIVQIGNETFNDKCQLYDKTLECYVNLRTYVVFNYMAGELIPLHIMRPQKDKQYTKKKLQLKARPLNTMKYVPITSNPEILEISGFIFGELSEDLINDYIRMGIYIGLSVGEHYLTKPYRNDNESVIILIGINKKVLSHSELKIVNRLGLPLVKESNNYYNIPVINRINKKKVNTIEQMKMLIFDPTEKIIQLKIHNNNGIRITVQNQKIIKIKIAD